MILRGLMRVSDARDDTESKRRKWELLEFTAVGGSDALKAGVIEEIFYLCSDEPDVCVILFEDPINQSPVLLLTH